MALNKTKLLPHQRMEMLTPAKVEREFGVPLETLSNMRQITLDTGTQRGPMFFKDVNIIFYRREWIVDYIDSKVINFATETQEQQEVKQFKKSS